MSKSMAYRLDERTEEVGSHNIQDYSEREHLWSLVLRHDFCHKGKPCNVIDNGVDGEGNFIRGKLDNYNVDKVYIFEDGTKKNIEIKTAPEWLEKFFTFKSFSLKGCIEQYAGVMVPKLNHYYYFPEDVIEWMLSYPHRIYPPFCPNKPAVRIPMKDIEAKIASGKVEKNIWHTGVHNLIEEYKPILTREKKS